MSTKKKPVDRISSRIRHCSYRGGKTTALNDACDTKSRLFNLFERIWSMKLHLKWSYLKSKRGKKFYYIICPLRIIKRAQVEILKSIVFGFHRYTFFYCGSRRNDLNCYIFNKELTSFFDMKCIYVIMDRVNYTEVLIILLYYLIK